MPIRRGPGRLLLQTPPATNASVTLVTSVEALVYFPQTLSAGQDRLLAALSGSPDLVFANATL
eukprot:7377318-Pyramimonas_sp.AAC.1